MKHLLFLFCLLMAATTRAGEYEPQTLRFHNGNFRIAQFTDFHWGDAPVDTVLCHNMVRAVVNSQKPDLIVLTGDIVTGGKAKTGWRQIISMMEETDTPYAVIMGNHDAECEPGIPADSIYHWLRLWAPHCLNAYYEEGIYGHGNKMLAIHGEKDAKVKAAVWCIDSNDYPKEPRLERYSYYDWIHTDQIDWYEHTSNALKAQNDGVPVPSLAFFHICLQEHILAGRQPHFGTFVGGASPAEVNSGFFQRAYVQGDIMGMFVGHDHTNDFVSMYKGIALGFGRQSGKYSHNERVPVGARLFDLKEGEHAFQSWICTMNGAEPRYYYPLDYNDTMCPELLPALDVKPKKHGIAYTYYENKKAKNVPEMLSGKVVQTGVMPAFDITQAPSEDHFGYSYDTYLLVDEDGPYRFNITSDDGAMLYIDGQLVIDNDGSHSRDEKHGYIGLKKGYHHLHLDYFEDYMGQMLKITVSTLKAVDQQILPEQLFYTK